MASRSQSPLPVDAVLVTDALMERALRSPLIQEEHEAMQLLLVVMTQHPAELIQAVVNTAVDLCQAGSAGLSLLETTAEGECIFRWVALAGTYKQYVGGHTPRNWSPCGVCLDQQKPILVYHPARAFTYFQEFEIPIVEGLVIPVNYAGKDLGTIWVVSHDDTRQFDGEDARMMTNLAAFTAVALRLQAKLIE